MSTLTGRKWPGALKGRYCAIQQHKASFTFVCAMTLHPAQTPRSKPQNSCLTLRIRYDKIIGIRQCLAKGVSMDEQLQAIKARREEAKSVYDGLKIKQDKHGRSIIDGEGLWVADCYSPEIAAHLVTLPADVDTLVTMVERLTQERNDWLDGWEREHDALEVVAAERDALRQELAKAKAGAWATVQNTVSNAGIFDMRRDVDSWLVRSTLTDHVGAGETFCDAIADLGVVLESDVPEVPA